MAYRCKRCELQVHCQCEILIFLEQIENHLANIVEIITKDQNGKKKRKKSKN